MHLINVSEYLLRRDCINLQEFIGERDYYPPNDSAIFSLSQYSGTICNASNDNKNFLELR